MGLDVDGDGDICLIITTAGPMFGRNLPTFKDPAAIRSHKVRQEEMKER